MSQHESCPVDTGSERGARVFVPPPLVFLTGIVACGLLGRSVAPPTWPLPPSVRVAVGVSVIVLALGLFRSAFAWFRRTGQHPRPWAPTPELILSGPYRFTRNPMYLGMTLVSVGAGVALGNLWVSLAAVPALLVVHLTAVLPEERYLEEKFGEPYVQFKRRVRRYL